MIFWKVNVFVGSSLWLSNSHKYVIIANILHSGTFSRVDCPTVVHILCEAMATASQVIPSPLPLRRCCRGRPSRQHHNIPWRVKQDWKTTSIVMYFDYFILFPCSSYMILHVVASIAARHNLNSAKSEKGILYWADGLWMGPYARQT